MSIAYTQFSEVAAETRNTTSPSSVSSSGAIPNTMVTTWNLWCQLLDEQLNGPSLEWGLRVVFIPHRFFLSLFILRCCSLHCFACDTFIPSSRLILLWLQGMLEDFVFGGCRVRLMWVKCFCCFFLARLMAYYFFISSMVGPLIRLSLDASFCFER